MIRDNSKICIGSREHRSGDFILFSCWLTLEVWCLADGCKYSYDFDGFSGNSTLELWRCMWRAVSSRHLDLYVWMSFLVKPKLGLQFALQFYAERKSGRSSNQLGWGLTPEFFHLRLCLCSLALSIAAIVLADLLATSSLLGNQDITNGMFCIFWP